jgi:zinc protease
VLYTSMPDEQIADINEVTLDQVKQFHRDFYGASHADVAFVGDFDENTASAAVTRLFGNWKNPQPFERAVRNYVAVDSMLEHLETPDKANAFFAAGQNLRLSDADPDYPAMLLAGFMTGGGFLNSRLASRLRQKEGLSYGAGAFISAQAQDQYGTFISYAIYAPQNMDKLIRAYREEIDKIVKDGFTKEEVDAAKSGYVQSRSQGRANDQELVGTLIARRFVGRTLAWDEELERRLMALSPAEVNAVVKKYIDPKKTVIVRAGDFAKNPPPKLTP